MQSEKELIELGLNKTEAIALREVIYFGYFSRESYNGDTITLDISDDNYAQVSVTLKNVKMDNDFVPEFCVSLDTTYISKTDKEYSFVCDTDYYDEEADALLDYKLSFTFDSIEIEGKSLKSYLHMLEEESPWMALSIFASHIYEKVRAPYLSSNEKEEALSPLLKEFYALHNNYKFENLENFSFEAIKSYLPKSKKTDTLFDKIRHSNNLNNQNKFIKHLFSHLSSKKYENAWRNILGLLNKSQDNYEEITPKFNKIIIDTHNYIDEVMHNNGYEGNYPSYKKCTKIKGIHLKRSMGETYFAGMEKATIFIDCTDNCTDNIDYGNITFESTTILGNSSNIADRYSAFFAKKGKGYFKVDMISYDIDDKGNVSFYENEIKIIPAIVCKRAEFIKLSKEEKKAYKFPKTKEEIIFALIIWLIIGVIFGIFMTLGFILIEFLMTIFTGLISEFPQLFLDTPWWMIFVFSSLAFGIIMWIINLFAE